MFPENDARKSQFTRLEWNIYLKRISYVHLTLLWLSSCFQATFNLKLKSSSLSGMLQSFTPSKQNNNSSRSFIETDGNFLNRKLKLLDITIWNLYLIFTSFHETPKLRIWAKFLYLDFVDLSHPTALREITLINVLSYASFLSSCIQRVRSWTSSGYGKRFFSTSCVHKSFLLDWNFRESDKSSTHCFLRPFVREI